MKSSGTLNHFVYAFVIAAIVYVIFYNGIEHNRTKNGPWQVTFMNESTVPTLVINEPQLGITSLKINFPGEVITPTNTFFAFKQPKAVPFPVPFGQCVFEDTTFQPGTIVFECYGHQIQLLPRILTIDGKEYPWQSSVTISLNKANTSRAAP